MRVWTTLVAFADGVFGTALLRVVVMTRLNSMENNSSTPACIVPIQSGKTRPGCADCWAASSVITSVEGYDKIVVDLLAEEASPAEGGCPT